MVWNGDKSFSPSCIDVNNTIIIKSREDKNDREKNSELRID